MNQKRFETWMKAVDDDLLEEAQRPMKKKRSGLYAVGATAACFALLLSVLAFSHWNARENVQTPSPIQESTAAELQQLGYYIPLPEDAESVVYSLIDSGGETPMAEVDFEREGQAYYCRALMTAQAEDISGIYANWTESLDWNVGTLTLQLRQAEDGTAYVGWYAPETGVQWCVGGEGDGLSLLHTAQQIVEALGYDMTVAPENAQEVVYNAFALDGLTVGETAFSLDGVAYSYRTAATGVIEEDFADISGMKQSFLRELSGQVLYCPARLSFDEGGQGKIVWFDVVPGLLYSLSMDHGASEAALQSMAEQLFTPAQGEVG
ncbi:MAG: hypothetical protein ACI3W8_06565 [Oscillospiraceae bacterium]